MPLDPELESWLDDKVAYPRSLERVIADLPVRSLTRAEADRFILRCIFCWLSDEILLGTRPIAERLRMTELAGRVSRLIRAT
jgi:hypothetical protein